MKESEGPPEVLHPARGDSLTPLERQLWRLRMVALEIQVMLRGFFSVEDVAKQIPDGLLFALSNHGLILITKFLEVWSDFGALSPRESRVVEVRRAVSPLVRRIQIWQGLESFRSMTIAHAYQMKNGRLVGPWHLLHTHQAPTYHAEVILLLQCAMHAVAGVLATFIDEYRALGPSFRSGLPSLDEGPGIRFGTEIQPSLRALLRDVDGKLTALGVPASNPVYAEFREELKPEERGGAEGG